MQLSRILGDVLIEDVATVKRCAELTAVRVPACKSLCAASGEQDRCLNVLIQKKYISKINEIMGRSRSNQITICENEHFMKITWLIRQSYCSWPVGTGTGLWF